MRLARRAAKTVLVLFILCDVLFAWEWWRHGPPMVVSGGEEIKPGEVSFRMRNATLPNCIDPEKGAQARPVIVPRQTRKPVPELQIGRSTP